MRKSHHEKRTVNLKKKGCTELDPAFVLRLKIDSRCLVEILIRGIGTE